MCVCWVVYVCVCVCVYVCLYEIFLGSIVCMCDYIVVFAFGIVLCVCGCVFVCVCVRVSVNSVLCIHESVYCVVLSLSNSS